MTVRGRGTILFVAIAMIAVAMAAGARLLQPRGAGAGTTPSITIALDCDTTTPAVDASCFYVSGTASLDVGVVLVNGSGASVELGAFNFDVITDQQAQFVPKAGFDANRDSNPDFNDAGVTGTWTCTPPPPDPDQNASPSIADSFLACYDPSSDGPTIAAGGSVLLATVHYASTDGYGEFTLANVSVSDGGFNEVASCNPVNLTGGLCPGASVTIGQVVTPSATPSATPIATLTPTATATPPPPRTPPVPPTGGVSSVLGLNIGVCVGAGIGIGGVPAINAFLDCSQMHTQDGPQSFQDFLHCLRKLCGISTVNEPLRASSADFAPIDLDDNQAHAGQYVVVIAFVDGDYPVQFGSDRGSFLESSGNPEDAPYTYLCYRPEQDPDCDANPATRGDGAVVALVQVSPDDPLGPVHVNVTQADVSQELTFTIAGPPASITFEFANGDDTVETGALPRTLAGRSPLPDACDAPAVFDAGAASLKKAVIITRVLDAFGTQLTGSFVDWDQPFSVTAETGRPGLFGPTLQGGVALPQIPTFNLGALGNGFPQIACGGEDPGALLLDARVSPVFDVAVSFDPPSASAVVNVVDPPGTSPVVIPTPELGAGGSMNVIAMNEGACAALNTSGTPSGPLSAPCYRLADQLALQQTLACTFPFPEPCPGPIRPTTQDFARLNLDGANTVYPGQLALIVAFVPGRNPVTFDAPTGGTFLTLGPGGSLSTPVGDYVCDTSVRTGGSLTGDPDCDPAAPDDGDGVVIGLLQIDAGAPPGNLVINVSQAGLVTPVTIPVAGPPATMSVDEVAPKGDLQSYYGPCPYPQGVRGHEMLGQNGTPNPAWTVFRAQVFDANGTPLPGAPISVTQGFVPGGPSVIAPSMFDLGPAGIGSPILVCAGAVPGDYTFGLASGAATGSITVRVAQDPDLPTPTATPGPLASIRVDVDCDPSADGIQSSCRSSVANSPLRVELVVTNMAPSVPAVIRQIGFALLAPRPSFDGTAGGSDSLNSNPDFNDAEWGSDWDCTAFQDYDPSDAYAGPGLGCTSAGGYAIPPSSTVRLATVSYELISSGGPQPLILAVSFARQPGVPPPPGESYGQCVNYGTGTYGEFPCDTASIETYDATDTPTATITPTDTPTPTLTDTPTPVPTVTDTPTPTPTSTPTVTSTPTATLTPSATVTGTPTATPTVTATNTPSATQTPVVTATATLAPQDRRLRVLRLVRDHVCAHLGHRSAACRALTRIVRRLESRTH